MEPHDPSYAATVGHRLTTFVLVAAIAVALFTIGDAVHGDPLDVAFDAAPALDFDALPKGVSPTGESRAGFTIEDPTAREQRLELAGNLVPLLLLISVLWLLRGVARSVRDGDPFGPQNVRRLRIIGVLLIVGSLAVDSVESALQSALSDPYIVSGRGPRHVPGLQAVGGDFAGWPLLCGLGAFVLAHVFAHGVRLREDVEATI